MKIDLTGVKGVIASILIVLSLILGVLNAVQGALPPTVESLGVTNFDTLQVGNGSAAEPAFGFTSDTDTGLYRSSANTIGMQGAVTFSAANVYANSGAIPIDGGIITPTAEIWSLTPAAAVTNTLAACTTGSKTILYNTANFAIIVQDTDNGVLAGNQTLGQYDAMPMACIDTKWVQVGPVSAN